MENRPFYPLFHHGLPISERRHEDGPGLYGTVCFHPSPKQKQYAWSEELAIKSNTKSNYQWSFGAYGFYNSLNTDGPVIFKKDGLTGILQKAFDDILANNPKAPKLTVQGDELNQIYFPGNFDTPTYGFAAFHQSTYNNLLSKGFHHRRYPPGLRESEPGLSFGSRQHEDRCGNGPDENDATGHDDYGRQDLTGFPASIAESFAPLPVHTRNIHVMSRSPKDTRQEVITCRCSAIWSRPKPNTT